MTDFRAISDSRKSAKAIDYITTVARRRAVPPAAPDGIVSEGRNAWRVGKAGKVAFLIDGAAYFAALDQAARQARHSIWIIGWDFDPDIRLMPYESSQTLGELLLELADENPALQIRILVWGMGLDLLRQVIEAFQGKRLFCAPSDQPAFRFAAPAAWVPPSKAGLRR